MYCIGCGQALVAGQAFCPRCGRATGLGRQVGGQPAGQAPAGMPWQPMGLPMNLPLGLVERRINALAMGWLVYAAVMAVFGFFGLAFAHAAMGGYTGPFWAGSHGYGHHHWAGMGMPFFFLRFAWVAMVLRVGLALAAGLGLMQKAPWGRWVAIVAGFLVLLHPPFGTVLGLWTLIVLLSTPNALGYQAMARG